MTIPAPMNAFPMVNRVTGAAFDRTYAGWLLERKLDGRRATIRVSTVMGGRKVVESQSRKGNAQQLPAAMVEELKRLDDGVYDGELCSTSGQRWDVRALKTGLVGGKGTALVLVLFDLLEVAIPGMAENLTSLLGCAYVERRRRLLDQLRKLSRGQTSVTTVESVPATWAAVEAIWAEDPPGEGAIVKRPDSTYRCDYRSPDWVKVKLEEHEPMTITGFETGKPGYHDPDGRFAKFAIKDKDGRQTTVKVLGNKLKGEVAADPDSYIGRVIVMQYQMRSPSGAYIHGVFDHFAAPGEIPRSFTRSSGASTMKTAKAPKTALVTATKKVVKAVTAKVAKAAPKVAPPVVTGRAGVDWAAAGRKAWETRKRNAEAKAAAEAAAAKPGKKAKTVAPAKAKTVAPKKVATAKKQATAPSAAPTLDATYEPEVGGRATS